VLATDHLCLLLCHLLKAPQVMGYALVKQPPQHVLSPDRFHHLVLLSLSELHVLSSVTVHVRLQLKAAFDQA
jgi:hypothetical protein